MGIRNNIKKTNFLPHDSDPNPGVTVCPVVSVGEVTDYRGTEKASGVGTIFFWGGGGPFDWGKGGWQLLVQF